jgi:hypothetical protein
MLRRLPHVLKLMKINYNHVNGAARHVTGRMRPAVTRVVNTCLQLVKHDGGSDVTVCRCSSAVGFIRQLT